MTDILGWLAAFILIIGLILIGRKWKHAFLFTVTGEVIYVYESWRIQRWDMVFLCVVFTAIAALNWWSWATASPLAHENTKREEEPSETGRARE